VAGHSQYANIKHRKAAVDAKRGKLWSKLSKQIIVAAKLGGGDPNANSRLRTAIIDAKAVSMPKDNIERAIKRGTGEIEGGDVEEVLYEGYGPGGVAILCEIMTDNRNRTAPEIRKLFEKHGGNLGATGCVAYLFERKGLFVIPASGTTEEQIFEVVTEAGAEDVRRAGEFFEVTCAPENWSAVSAALEKASITSADSRVTRLPQTTVEVAGEAAQSVLRLVEALDDHDDIQTVVANFSIPDQILAALNSQTG
jgi:YebC/PmpR family DNA-binding regulatory protein